MGKPLTLLCRVRVLAYPHGRRGVVNLSPVRKVKKSKKGPLPSARNLTYFSLYRAHKESYTGLPARNRGPKRRKLACFKQKVRDLWYNERQVYISDVDSEEAAEKRRFFQ